MNKITFESLSLSEQTLQALKAMGFEEPTPIQAAAIPELLTGIDLIGQAKTGTGKTAAFALPILEKIDTTQRTTQALVMCPTRELALQVCEQVQKLGQYKKLNVVAIYGGEQIERQFTQLKKGAHVIVGTPGRLLDHLERGTLSLDNIQTVVLDEADEMLDMGFLDDIESIIEQTPTTRQTVLFSATMSSRIKDMARKFQKNPKMVSIQTETVTSNTIEECYYQVDSSSKTSLLSVLLTMHEPTLAIVFSNTKRKVEDIIDALQARGHVVDGLHGDMNQNKRNRVMSKFREKQIKVLVATDVAARGIDVSDVDIVFNYDLPQDKESYVHRIGRTGRAGKMGKALSLVSGRDMSQLRFIQRYTSAPIKQLPLPTAQDIERAQAQKIFSKIQEIRDNNNLDGLKKVVEQLHQEHQISYDEIAAALLHMRTKRVNASEIKSSGSGDYEDRSSRYDGRSSSSRGGFGGRRRSSNSSGSRSFGKSSYYRN